MGELDDLEQGFWRDGRMKLERRPHSSIQGMGHVRNLWSSRIVRPGNRTVSGGGMSSPCWALGVRLVRKGMASSQPSVIASVMSPNRRSISSRAFSWGTACGIVTMLLGTGGGASWLRTTSSHGDISPASCCRRERSGQDGGVWYKRENSEAATRVCSGSFSDRNNGQKKMVSSTSRVSHHELAVSRQCLLPEGRKPIILHGRGSFQRLSILGLWSLPRHGASGVVGLDWPIQENTRNSRKSPARNTNLLSHACMHVVTWPSVA